MAEKLRVLFGIALLLFVGCLILTFRMSSLTVFLNNLSPSNLSDDGLFVIKHDGQVRDCITGEIRGTGVRGKISTSEFVPIPNTFQTDGKTLYTVVEDRNNSAQAFKKIFHERLWNAGAKGEAASGPGSTLNFAVETMVGINVLLNDIKLRHGLKRIRMLDIPCGDMMWMRRFLETRDDIDYTGIDIVPDIISNHQKAFAGKPWKFIQRDLIMDGLGDQFDFVHCRHMLQHLATPDAMTFLYMISKSGSKYLLTTSFPDSPVNDEVSFKDPSRFRHFNLEAPPISLTQPICYFHDGPPTSPNYLLLWKLPLQSVVACAAATSLTFPATQTSVRHYACGNWSM